MAEEEALESGQHLECIKDVVCASTADAIVLETKSLESWFVAEDSSELTHSVIIEVVVVQEDFDQGCVLGDCSRNSLKSQVANQI